MSHFSVIVVADEEPTDEVLQNAMQLYHEFECTGEDDQYVQEVFVTEQIREEWGSGSQTQRRRGSGVCRSSDQPQCQMGLLASRREIQEQAASQGCASGDVERSIV